MKKTISLLLALVLCLSLCACGGNSNTPVKPTKDELLSVAVPLVQDEADKIFDNAAYAKTLVSNTYTFTGKVFEIDTDYVDIALRDIPDENGKLMGYDYWNLSFHLYLPIEELANVSNNDIISFVGQISDVKTKKTTDPNYGYEISGTIVIMDNVYIID